LNNSGTLSFIGWSLLHGFIQHVDSLPVTQPTRCLPVDGRGDLNLHLHIG